MISFWENQSFLNFDLIVIGSGIVGLSTACSFKERNPHLSVLILESGIFPSGASTKNAGFACYGSAAEIWHDVSLLGEDKALEVVSLRIDGLRKLRHRLGDSAIDYQELGGGEIFLKGEDFNLEHIPQLNQWLHPLFGKEVFVPDLGKIKELGFQPENIQSFVINTVEGQIDTGKMMKSLISYTRSKDIEIYTGCRAGTPENIGEKWRIPIENSSIVFNAVRVAVCTNAFTPRLFPDLDIKPGRGQILVTKPIPDLKFKGIFHFDEGYFYFRNFENRVIFGGGRNLDFKGEETDLIELNNEIQAKLDFYLDTLILPKNTHWEVEHRWAGIMAFGKEKLPIIKDMGNGLVVGARMNGMGVAIGTEVGEKLADFLK